MQFRSENDTVWKNDPLEITKMSRTKSEKDTVNGPHEHSVMQGGGCVSFLMSADISVATMVICLQGNVKRGAWIKAPLFKGLNTEKRPFMAHFESNKQTQKCYVTEWVKRNAVIKQRLCLCAAHKRTISPDLFPSVPVWWTVNVAIVKLTASFSGAGHRFQTIPPQCLVRNCAGNVIQPAIFIIIFSDCNKNPGFLFCFFFAKTVFAMWEARMSWVITAATAWLEFSLSN